MTTRSQTDIERVRERERESVCVCVRECDMEGRRKRDGERGEREREREERERERRERERERERERKRDMEGRKSEMEREGEGEKERERERERETNARWKVPTIQSVKDLTILRQPKNNNNRQQKTQGKYFTTRLKPHPFRRGPKASLVTEVTTRLHDSAGVRVQVRRDQSGESEILGGIGQGRATYAPSPTRR